jgi:glycosyltransferase involved in cell wall biosynthesis
MKIAFVTFDFPPFAGSTGSGVYATHVVNSLATMGHEVFVYVPEADGNSFEQSLSRVHVHRVPVRKRLLKAPQFWLRLPRAVTVDHNRSKFDIVHFNGLSYWFMKKRILPVPQVMTVHHLTKDATATLKSDRPFISFDFGSENAFFLPFIERRAIESLDGIIAVTKYTKERIYENYNVAQDKISVIYNAVDMTSGEQPSNLSVKQAYDLPNAVPTLLFVGRVDDPRKNLDILLKAFKLVRDQHEAILIAVGSGSNKKAKQLAIELGVESSIIFAGFVPDDVLKGLYKSCAVYVCPSRLEGFGLTILESMAFSKPIVAMKAGAIPELLTNEKNGILVEPGDISGLANGICRLLEDPRMSAEIGINNEQYAKHFSWMKNAKEVERVYLSLLAGG